jgi:hypothetical protein
LIVLSLDELSRNNSFFKWMFEWSLLDVRVAMLNQIMYTFHRRTEYVVESLSKESWYWTIEDFKNLNPLLRYDYGNSYKIMIFSEIINKIWKFLALLFIYGTISVINALFIRVSIKSSVLMVFPLILLQNRFSNNPLNRA